MCFSYICLMQKLEYVVLCGSKHVHVKNAIYCVSLLQHSECVLSHIFSCSTTFFCLISNVAEMSRRLSGL